jgi:hypothetical protein
VEFANYTIPSLLTFTCPSVDRGYTGGAQLRKFEETAMKFSADAQLKPLELRLPAQFVIRGGTR